MQTIKILEMINEGRLDELKAVLQDELYVEALKGKPDAKKRYAAMKKYFTYIPTGREALQKPCKIAFEGEDYISFCNSHSLVLTTENCGEIELYEDVERYPDITRLIRFDGESKRIDFNKMFAEAKSKGYRLKKSELNSGQFKYLIQYDGVYFKLGLIDATFSVINDGELATVYHQHNKMTPLTIKNDLGYCVIMPMRLGDDDPVDNYCVINLEGE